MPIRHSTRRLALAIGLCLTTLYLCFAVAAQEPPAPTAPILSEINQLRLQNALKDYEIARLRLVAIAQALHVPGYELDVNTLTYRKITDPPKEAK